MYVYVYYVFRIKIQDIKEVHATREWHADRSTISCQFGQMMQRAVSGRNSSRILFGAKQIGEMANECSVKRFMFRGGTL